MNANGREYPVTFDDYEGAFRSVFNMFVSVRCRALPWSIQLPLDSNHLVPNYSSSFVAFVVERTGLRPLAILSCPARSFVIFISS